MLIGVQRAMESVREQFSALPADSSAIERVCTAYGAHLEMVLTDSVYNAAAMRTVGQLPPHIRERQLEQQREYGALWRDLISEVVEAGEIDPALDPRAARMLLLGAMNWAPEWWNRSHGTLEDIVASAQRLVRNALTGSGKVSGTEQSA